VEIHAERGPLSGTSCDRFAALRVRRSEKIESSRAVARAADPKKSESLGPLCVRRSLIRNLEIESGRIGIK
jgi:hypothetical protein